MAAGGTSWVALGDMSTHGCEQSAVSSHIHGIHALLAAALLLPSIFSSFWTWYHTECHGDLTTQRPHVEHQKLMKYFAFTLHNHGCQLFLTGSVILLDNSLYSPLTCHSFQRSSTEPFQTQWVGITSPSSVTVWGYMWSHWARGKGQHQTALQQHSVKIRKTGKSSSARQFSRTWLCSWQMGTCVNRSAGTDGPTYWWEQSPPKPCPLSDIILVPVYLPWCTHYIEDANMFSLIC